MDRDTLIKLTNEGESQYAVVPSKNDEIRYTLTDIDEKFRDFIVRDDFIALVGSTVIHGEGNDVDLVVRGNDLSDELKEAIMFRLYRQFAGVYGIDYDEVPEHLHIHFSEGPYTDYLGLYRLKLERVPDAEVVRMSKSFSIISKSRRIIGGYASVTVVDSEGHYIPESTLNDALLRFMKDEGYRNLMLSHSAVQIGKVLDGFNGYTTHVDDYGLYIVAEIRSDIEIANKVWSDILSGKLSGLSIHAEVEESHKDKDVLVIDKMNLFEISVCESPVNELSRFKVLAKGGKKVSELEEEEVVVNAEADDRLSKIEKRLTDLEKSFADLAASVKRDDYPLPKQKAEDVEKQEDKKKEEEEEEMKADGVSKYPYPDRRFSTDLIKILEDIRDALKAKDEPKEEMKKAEDEDMELKKSKDTIIELQKRLEKLEQMPLKKSIVTKFDIDRGGSDIIVKDGCVYRE